MSKNTEIAMNAVIDHLKKSPVLNKTIELLDSTIDEINKKFKHDPISLDELTSRLSDDTDKEILQIQQQENLCFIGGELLVSKTAQLAGCFSLDLKLYFQNQMEKIILKEKHKELQISILNEASQNDLLQQSIIKYEINEPNIKE